MGEPNINIKLPRRDFLKLLAAEASLTFLSSFLAACQRAGLLPATPTVEPPTLTPLPTSISSATPPPPATAIPTKPATRTPDASPTAKATATVTATKVPEVLPGISVPSSDLLRTTPDSPIGQYAKALGLDPNAVKGELTYQEKTDVKGNKFAIAVTKDGTPLFIATQDQKSGEWGWSEASGSIISNRRGIERGVLLEWYRAEKDPKYLQTITKDYNHISLNTEFVWKYLRPNGNKLDEYDLNKINQALKFAKTNNLTVDLEGLIWGLRGQLPDWLVKGNFTKDELTEIMTNHIKEILTKYKGKFERVNIISEPFGNKWEGSFWSDKLGVDNHVQTAFRTAREVDPNATLTIVDINDSDQLFNLVKRLNEQEQLTNNRKLIDAVGWEMPFFLPGSNIDVKDYLDPQKRASALKKFRQNIQRYHKIGVEVYITELFVDMTDIPGTPQQKSIFQAELYKKIQEICIEEGVPITTYSFYDNPTIYPQGAGRPNAAPYPRDQEYRPKTSYYSLLDALLNTPLSPPK